MPSDEPNDDYDYLEEGFEPDPLDLISGDMPEWNLPNEYKSEEQLEAEWDIAGEIEQQFRDEIIEPELNNFFVDIFANAIQIEDKIGDIICHHFCDLEQIKSFQISIISRLGFAQKIRILREIITEYDDLKNLNSVIKKIDFIKEVRNGFAHRKQGWISHYDDVKKFTITLTKYENGKKKELVLDKKKRDQTRRNIDTCNEDLKKIDSEIRTKRNHNSQS